MNVQPDFLDHWKRKKLARLLSDLPADEDFSVTIPLRLWAHCQTQRAWSFHRMTPEILSAICHWPHDPNVLMRALLDCHFIVLSKNGKTFTVHQWEVHNKALVAYWTRGKRGGRPSSTHDESSSPDDNGSSPPDELSLGDHPATIEPKQRTDNNNKNSTSTPVGVEGARPSKSKAKRHASVPSLVRSHLVDAQHLAALKKIFRPADVDLCVARFKAFLLGPKGRGRAFTKKGLEQWLKDAQPLVEGEKKAAEQEVPGWRDLLSEANPEFPQPNNFFELSEDARKWVRKLSEEKQRKEHAA